MADVSQNTHYPSARVAVVLGVLAVLAYLWFSTDGFRHWGIDQQHLASNGQLSEQAIEELRSILLIQDVDGLQNLIDQSPGLWSFVEREAKSSEDRSLAYQAQLLELISLGELNSRDGSISSVTLAVHLEKEWVATLNNTLSDHQPTILPVEGSTSDSLDAGQAILLANTARLLAGHYQGTQLVEFQATLLGIYQAEKDRRSPDYSLKRGLLQAIWLSTREDNPRWVEQYLQLINASDDATTLAKESDLMKLLGSDQPQVVINAARVIGSITPQHAITSLRYRLAKAKDQQIKFALLDAIGHFGEAVDVLEPQLKRMQQITEDEDLRHKIRLTLDQLRGRSA